MVPASVPASRLYPADPPPSLRPYVVLAIVIPATSPPPLPLPHLSSPSLKLFSHFSPQTPLALLYPIVTNQVSLSKDSRLASISLFIRRRVSSIFAWLPNFFPTLVFSFFFFLIANLLAELRRDRNIHEISGGIERASCAFLIDLDFN